MDGMDATREIRKVRAETLSQGGSHCRVDRPGIRFCEVRGDVRGGGSLLNEASEISGVNASVRIGYARMRRGLSECRFDAAMAEIFALIMGGFVSLL